MARSKGGYYAVQKGRNTGVFASWQECESNIKGFTGAVYKKFDTRAEAEAFANSHGGYRSSPSLNANHLRAGSRPAAGFSDPFDWKSSRDSSPFDTASLPPTPSRGQAGTPAGRTRSSTPGSNVTFPRPMKHRTINVYVDGSGLGNGKDTARAGWGVYWEDESLHGLNEARRLPGPIQTNNRAELMAMIRAIQLCPDPDAQLVIHTDSQYSMDCIEKWITSWRQKRWTSSTGKDVLNRDLIRRLDREMRGRKLRPKLVKVAAHQGVYGNEMADRLAKHGATLPAEMEREGLEPPPSDQEDEGQQQGGAFALRGGAVSLKAPFKRGLGTRAGNSYNLDRVGTPSQAFTEATPTMRIEYVGYMQELDGLDDAAFMTNEELRELEEEAM